MADAAREQERLAQEERNKIADEQNKKKQDDLLKLQEQINAQEGDEIDINMDIDSMPDCRLKYDIIIKRSKANGYKHTDVQFPAENSSIGPKTVESIGAEFQWKRFSEHTTAKGESHVVFLDGADASDLNQGMLGDCYFLSALAVLGTKVTREKFIFLNTDEEFMQCGAFCIKFYLNGIEDIVIIDDLYPMINGD